MDESVASTLLRARYWNEAVSIEAGVDAHRLGSGGLFIATASPPSKGSLLDFELAVGGPPPVRGIVEVVDVRPLDDATGELPAGMKIKFVHLDDESHAREVLGRMVVAQTASLPPPPAVDPDVAPSSTVPRTGGGVVWDRAVALEEDFFERASRVPVIIPDDEIAEKIAERQHQPEFIARQQRLRKTVVAVVAIAAVLFAASALRMRSEEKRADRAPVVPAAPAHDVAPAAPAAPVSPPASPAAASAAPTEPASAASAPAAPSAAPAVSAAPSASPEAATSAPSAIPPAAQLRPPASRPRSAGPGSRPASRPKAPHAAPARQGDIYD